MRSFCWSCHRPVVACFCALVRSFSSFADFALVVHPSEVKSTVGTAWILRRSISNLKWVRSSGVGLDQDPKFLELLNSADRVPLVLFPGPLSFNLNRDSEVAWRELVPPSKRPLFIVIDGTWTQARSMMGRSLLRRSLPRVSFETEQLSEYEFKKQPHPACLSSVEGVHRVIEVLADRDWGKPPIFREHDQMIEIFRGMVKFQLEQENKTETQSRMTIAVEG